MPIYGDYHGDFQNSSISTWDQIQISLKILLPSYQPFLSDSAVVESFLTNQNQMQIENKEEDEEITDRRYHDSVSVFEGGVARSAEVGVSAKRKVEHRDLLVAGVEMVTRPPPKPPHLQSQAGVYDDVEDVADLNSQGCQRSKASDGAVDRSCHDCGGDIDDKAVSSARVGAFMRGRWSTSTVEDGTTERTVALEVKPHGTTNTCRFGAVMRRLRQLFLLTPPPLLAAVFPWNRNGDGMVEQEQEREAKVQGAEVVAMIGNLVLCAGEAQEYTLKRRMQGSARSGSGLAGVGDSHGALWRHGSGGVMTIFCSGGEWLGFMEPSVTLRRPQMREKMLNPLQDWMGLQDVVKIQFHSTIGLLFLSKT
ncbi:hypothetical protein PIB30_016099 [Stylosanthes scabra]|uniref:Uncharacterized protein n=1 Tax=Stylosanthes scabra TaxID=79078 RepID=A0ABU6Q715_9FABA|nr:hypothetical protein [Stylosanthes scabra]